MFSSSTVRWNRSSPGDKLGCTAVDIRNMGSTSYDCASRVEFTTRPFYQQKRDARFHAEKKQLKTKSEPTSQMTNNKQRW
jgi:hypothetical protein